MPQNSHLRLSRILGDLRRDIVSPDAPDSGTIRLADLFAMMGEQAAAALLLVFSLVTLIPNIPGATSFLGLPVVILCGMMALHGEVRVPQSLQRLSISRSRLSSFLSRAIPLVERVERLARPRLTGLFSGRRERLLWGLSFILSIAILIPLPFTAMLPSLALCLMAIGLMERDGLWILVGGTVGLMALFVLAFVSRILLGILALAFQG